MILIEPSNKTTIPRNYTLRHQQEIKRRIYGMEWASEGVANQLTKRVLTRESSAN